MNNRFNKVMVSASVFYVTGFAAMASTAVAEVTQEERLKSLENQVMQQQRKITALESASRSGTAAKTLNPDISLILSGRYVDFGGDESPSHNELLNGEEEGLEQGIGLGESELIISANADEHFYGQMVLAVASEDGEAVVELEEAFVQSTLMPGVKAKAGRFLSGFGYQNEQHPHAWDLSIAPLVYRYFLGGGYGDDGVQLNYVLPSTTFVMVGAEALKGGAYPATPDTEVGTWVGYINVGADIGDRASWLIGLNHLRADAVERAIETDALADAEGVAAFTGESKVDGLEFVLKIAPTGNMKQQHFKLQSEYMRSRDDGQWAVDVPDTVSSLAPYKGDREGYYVQATYQWEPRWRTSLRYDRMEGELRADADAIGALGLTTPWEPKQISAGIDWVPSEFSHVRLQYTRDDTPLDVGDIWLVAYTVSLGAHGAHRY